MSMYAMIFGQNQASSAILATLSLSPADFGRFRDAFVANGEIAVYTRCGGGNRDAYESVFDRMAVHPYFLRDADDDFDCTYATFYFSYPPEFADDLKLVDIGEPFNPSQRWADMLATLKSKVSP